MRARLQLPTAEATLPNLEQSDAVAARVRGIRGEAGLVDGGESGEAIREEHQPAALRSLGSGKEGSPVLKGLERGGGEEADPASPTAALDDVARDLAEEHVLHQRHHVIQPPTPHLPVRR